jgi:uncharacterized protein (TIGR02646 family)
MKYSAKGPPPQTLVDWLGGDWVPTWAAFQNPEKGDVHESLLAEQEFVCCYCGRSLKGDRSDSHIDHFRPQKTHNGKGMPDLTLAYGNFVASCGPPGRNGRPSTCGDAKGDQFNESSCVEPWDPGCEQRFAYGSFGVIGAAVTGDAAAETMIKFLNLLDESLVLDRRTLLSAFEADIAGGLITAANVSAEIQRLRTPEAGRRVGFSHIAARYLEVEFG